MGCPICQLHKSDLGLQQHGGMEQLLDVDGVSDVGAARRRPEGRQLRHIIALQHKNEYSIVRDGSGRAQNKFCRRSCFCGACRPKRRHLRHIIALQRQNCAV